MGRRGRAGDHAGFWARELRARQDARLAARAVALSNLPPHDAHHRSSKSYAAPSPARRTAWT